MPETWVVDLAAWIVQDGNYKDFTRGSETRFAVEFDPRSLTAANSSTRMARHLGEARYRVVGQVVFASKAAWVIDCGLLAYCDYAPPADIVQGLAVEGETTLGVDPFNYFEKLAKLPEIPSLIYDWSIDRIELNTAPWVEIAPRTSARDASRPGWKDVEATDAWNDDDGHGGYLLHSRLLDRRTRRDL